MVLYAGEDTSKNRSSPSPKLPFYNEDLKPRELPPPAHSSLEPSVRSARLKLLGIWNGIQAANQSVSSKWMTAKAHSMGAVEFLQNEPELWQRVAIIGIAGVTGLISGYRRSGLVKLRNTVLLSGVATTMCYPKQTVAATTSAYHVIKKPFAGLWEEYSPWSENKLETVPSKTEQAVEEKAKVEEDLGQSKPEDKDMYSTRQ